MVERTKLEKLCDEDVISPLLLAKELGIDVSEVGGATYHTFINVYFQNSQCVAYRTEIQSLVLRFGMESRRNRSLRLYFDDKITECSSVKSLV